MPTKNLLTLLAIGVAGACFWAPAASAASFGYADVVLDYFDSGAGPIPGPYGGTFPGAYPVPVALSVVLGDDPGPVVDFLSLPTGSYVTVGFVDELVIDGPGNDLFIQEAGVAGERANVYVSDDLVNFTFLGVAVDNATTAFDLSTIAFAGPVLAVKIVGLDALGASPGFDVVNVQGLPGSLKPVPEPASLTLMGIGVAALGLRRYVRRHS